MTAKGPRLRDLGLWFSGGTPPKDRSELWDGDVPWVSGKDFESTRLQAPVDHITAQAARAYSAVMPAGSIVALVRGMALVHGLPVALVPKDVAINQDVRGVVLRPELEARFVHYALLAIRRRLAAHIDRAAHGTARFVESGYAERLPDPRALDQIAVADFLDRECDRIEAIATRFVQLVALATDSHWENAAREMLLEPGQRQGVPLKRLVERPVGGSWGSEPGEDEVDVVVVRVADFDRPSLTLRRCETIRSVSHAAASRLALSSGDLLIEKSGGGEKSPVGFVVQYAGSGISISSNFLARLRPVVNVDPTYLGLLFGALYAAGRNVPYVRQVTGIQNLDLSGYLTEHVPVREIAEQRELGQRLRRRLEQVNALRARCTIASSLLSEYRDALVTEVVTGRLDITRLSDAQLDESAHATLEGETPEVLAA